MSVPERRPDFSSIYPTAESFQLAMERFEQISAGTPEIDVAAAMAMESPRRSQDAPRVDVALRRVDVAPRPKPGEDLLDLQSIRGASMRLLEKNKARILSEHEGLVKRLLLSVPKVKEANSGKKVDSRHLGHLKSVMRAFGSSVEYVIVAAPDQRPELEQIATDTGASHLTFVLSPHFNVSIWVQDAHVAMYDYKGTSILLEGVAYNRFEDMSVADDVARQTPVRALQSDLYFQGGNILGGSDVTLVGRDYLFRNTERFGIETEAKAQAEFARLFNTDILGLGDKIDPNHKDLFKRGVLSGYGLQPIFHIDMYVTRTGVYEDGKEVVFLGRPGKTFELTGMYSDMPEFDKPVYDSFFERTAEQLATRFRVRELPLFLTFGNLRDINKRQKFYNLTWNNAIVENDGTTKRVLLPNYACKKDAKEYGVDSGLRQELQTFAEEQWKDLGFDVRFTDSMEDLAWGDGAVHCMTKVLSRTLPQNGSSSQNGSAPPDPNNV